MKQFHQNIFKDNWISKYLFTENMNLNTRGPNQEVEAEGSEAQSPDEGQNESNTEENHHMNIIEEGDHCIPSILSKVYI